ncbi:MAG: outer membrane protein assembly factor BamA [Candidatus Omnitrophica bacterium]|jgi:outer membrane protein insertion porin family|nr:outer membrane protein assembly factor BamA [Candidatus Omnitrophota bacterium]
MKRKFFSLAIATLMFASHAMFMPAKAAAADDGAVVSEVTVAGNETVALQTILTQLRTVPGKPASTQVLSEDLKRLYSLGYFKDVQIKQETDPATSKVKVIFVVKEKPVLREVEITGNVKIKTKDIEAKVKSKAGDFFDEQQVRRDVDAAKKLYEEKGYYDAGVRYKTDFDPTANQAKLQIIVDEGAKLVVKQIEFEGVKAIKVGDLKSKIETKAAQWFWISGALKKDALDLDLQRIQALYDEYGYSDAKATYKTENLNDRGDIRLIFVVEEGQLYQVGTVNFRGNQVFTNDEIVKAMELKSGSPFSRKGLRQSVTNIQDLYFEKGYMNAKVAFDSVYNEQTQRVDVSYKITENNITSVNRIIIRGNNKTQDIVIRRELRVYPGEPFNGAALKKSKERLFNLGFFEEVQLDTADTANADSKDLVVTVKETKTGEFSFGGGFSSIDKAVGFVQVRQSNFDIADWPSFTGAGQDLTARVQLGSVRSQGELSWTDPWFMGNPFSLGFDLYRREYNKTRSSGLFFDEKQTGGRIRIGKELTDYDSISTYYGFEQVEISDIADTASADLRAEIGKTNVSRVGATLTHDTRDNRFVPTKGNLLQGGAELAGGVLGGDRDFWKLTGLGATYRELFKDNILELKLRGGIADAYDDSEKVPIFERYYAGGANTVRGYRERRIGPRDTGTQDPIGGEAYWVGNAEYTFPIFPGVIKGAAFYDVGTVDATIEDIGNEKIYSGVGLGIRVKTPIGPLKVDAGYPLDDVEGEGKDVRFYFNMSRGF